MGICHICLPKPELREPWRIESYSREGGYEVWRRILNDKPDPADVVEQIKASGLRGRGGAGFPAGLKWSFLAKDVLPRYLACNADESEPGTCKDRELLEKTPHLLIEGIIVTCYACRIETGYIYYRGEFQHVR